MSGVARSRLQALRDGLTNDVVSTHVWPRILAAWLDVLTAVSNKAADFAAAHGHQLPAPLADPPIPAGHPFLAVDGGVLRAQLPVDVEELVA